MVRRLALGALLLGVAAAPAPAGAHPLHVTYADVVVAGGAATMTVTVTLRVYTDDLLRAAGGAAHVDAYVRAHFALADASGRGVALVACGAAARGDMTHLCLRGAAPSAALRVTNDLLVTLYADQINLVRVNGGRTALLTRARRVQTL